MWQKKNKTSERHHQNTSRHQLGFVDTFANVPNKHKEDKSSKIISRGNDGGPLTGEIVSFLQSRDDDVDDTIYDETFEEIEDALPKHVPLNFIEEL